jgi:hypothetical protein
MTSLRSRTAVAVEGQAAGVARHVDAAAFGLDAAGAHQAQDRGREAHAEAVDGGLGRGDAGSADLQGEREVAREFGVGADHADAQQGARDGPGRQEGEQQREQRDPSSLRLRSCRGGG